MLGANLGCISHGDVSVMYKISFTEIQVDKIYGPKLTWADFVMGLNDPEPPSYTFKIFCAGRAIATVYSLIENHLQYRITYVNFPIYFFHLMKQSLTFCIVTQRGITQLTVLQAPDL